MQNSMMLMPAPRAWTGIFAAVALLSSTVPSAHAAAPGTQPSGAVHQNLRYMFTPRDQAPARQQSLDLYLPAGATGKLPLIAFVHGGFWRESDDSYGIGHALAQALLPSGVAVALIRYPLAPRHKFPAQAGGRRAGARVSAPRRRPVRPGHEARLPDGPQRRRAPREPRGARRPLPARRRRAGAAVAGVIAVSGIYDLGAGGSARLAREGAGAARLRQRRPRASGMHRPSPTRAPAPPFLVLSAENDFDGFQIDARRFAARLRAAGNRDVQEIVVQGVDHFTIFKSFGGDAQRAARPRC